MPLGKFLDPKNAFPLAQQLTTTMIQASCADPFGPRTVQSMLRITSMQKPGTKTINNPPKYPLLIAEYNITYATN